MRSIPREGVRVQRHYEDSLAKLKWEKRTHRAHVGHVTSQVFCLHFLSFLNYFMCFIQLRESEDFQVGGKKHLENLGILGHFFYYSNVYLTLPHLGIWYVNILLTYSDVWMEG